MPPRAERCISILFHSIPLVAMMGGIYYFSDQPGDTLDLPSFFGADKLFHAVAYGVLALCALFALEPFEEKIPLIPRLAGVVVFCALYGVGDEVHQAFIPNRTMSALDVAADLTGAVIAALLAALRRSVGSEEKKLKSSGVPG